MIWWKSIWWGSRWTKRLQKHSKRLKLEWKLHSPSSITSSIKRSQKPREARSWRKLSLAKKIQVKTQRARKKDSMCFWMRTRWPKSKQPKKKPKPKRKLRMRWGKLRNFKSYSSRITTTTAVSKKLPLRRKQPPKSPPIKKLRRLPQKGVKRRERKGKKTTKMINLIWTWNSSENECVLIKIIL